MAEAASGRPLVLKFPPGSQADVLKARNMKYRQIISQLVQDLTQLEYGNALKIPLTELPDSKENVRSALHRVTRLHGMNIVTSDDAGYMYVWKLEDKPAEENALVPPYFAVGKAVTPVTNSEEGTTSEGQIWIKPLRKVAGAEKILLPVADDRVFQEMKNAGAGGNGKKQCGSQRGNEVLRDLA